MARLKLKQVLSNLYYDTGNDQLILSGSKVPTANQIWNETSQSWEEVWGNWDGSRNGIPDFVIYGQTFVTSSIYSSGSITIDGVNTFGDSGSFDSIDLGEY
jgi:hypothetical protein